MTFPELNPEVCGRNPTYRQYLNFAPDIETSILSKIGFEINGLLMQLDYPTAALSHTPHRFY